MILEHQFGQDCEDLTLKHDTELLTQFASLDELRLHLLEDKYIDKVSSGATRVVFQEIVVPRITDCMFCASSTLSVKVKTQACG